MAVSLTNKQQTTPLTQLDNINRPGDEKAAVTKNYTHNITRISNSTHTSTQISFAKNTSPSVEIKLPELINTIKNQKSVTAGPSFIPLHSNNKSLNDYFLQFQNSKLGAPFSQGRSMDRLQNDDAKKLTAPINNHTSVQGKFFLNSRFTGETVSDGYQWNVRKNNDGKYDMFYEKGTKNGEKLAIPGNRIANLINHVKIEEMKKTEADTFSNLLKNSDKHTAANELKNYEWRMLGDKSFVYKKNSTAGRPLFKDNGGILPGQFNLSVIKEMEQFENPRVLSVSAHNGACLGISCLWLRMIIGGEKEMAVQEEAFAMLKNKQQYLSDSLSKRRMNLLGENNLTAGVKWQNLYLSFMNNANTESNRLHSIASRYGAIMRDIENKNWNLGGGVIKIFQSIKQQNLNMINIVLY